MPPRDQMSKHKQQLGKEGEELARIHLQTKGFKILALNYRYGRAEVDIIAQEKDVIVFVEVKTRETEKYGMPEDAIGTAKMNKLAEGAKAFLEENNLHNQCRYDIISIIKNQYKTELKHFTDAFWPGLY